MSEREIKLLEDIIESIGAFRFLQLSNEIDGNNWTLARRYGLTPRDIVFLRNTFFEQRVYLKPAIQQHINNPLYINNLQERKSV